MKVGEIFIGFLSWIVYLVSAFFLLFIAIGNISVVFILFLLAPLSLLNLFRDFFPEESQEVIIRFDFSWFDLILYVPGAVLTYFLIVKIVYPCSAIIFQHFVIEPFKAFLKKD